jgi:signal transduction histidine kinase/PAS domain-containing protein/ActR/RegA family two-component response regulator
MDRTREEANNFHETMQALLAANPDAICSFQLNLTKNTCVTGNGSSQYISRLLDSDTTDGLFEHIIAIIPEEKQRQDAIRFFSRIRLIDTFNKGITNVKFDYQRLDEHNNLIWVRTFAKMFKDPDTHDIISVFNSLNVSKEKWQEQQINEQEKKKLENTVLDTIGRLPSISVLFKVIDGQLVPERYSDEFCALKGCTQDNIREFNSLDAFAPVHPDDKENLKKEVRYDEAEGRYRNSVYRILTKNRGYIWVSVNYVSFKVGEEKYLYAVYTDIDDLKKQEQLLVEKYNSAQAFLDNFSGGYYVTRRINLTTNKIEGMQGTAPINDVKKLQTYDALVATILDHMPQKEMRKACANFYSRHTLYENFKKGISTTTLVYQVRDYEGNIKWVRATNTVSTRPGNGDIILFNAVSDVTKDQIVARIMEQVVNRQYDYLACLDADKGTIVTFISNTDTLTEDMIKPGMKYESAMKEYNDKYVIQNEDNVCTEFMSLKNVIKRLDNKERCIFSATVREHGAVRVKQVEFFYVDKASNLVALVRTDYTETQKKQLEQETKLHAALVAAQKANKAKTQFLSNMSHDIRTPLNGIIGMTYLTKEMDLPPQAKENLEKIDTSSKFLLSLINDILDMAKAESGKIVLHPEPYTNNEFSDYLESIIKPLCDSKGQNLVVDIQILDAVVPLVDKLRINQIFFNVLSNAVKYTPEGGTVTFWMREELTADKKLAVDVQIKDNGIGMSEEFQKVLFTAFTQEERDQDREKQGTGLGLAIVKHLMKLMKGTLSVKSVLNQGTTFFLHFAFDCLPATEVNKEKELHKKEIDLNYLKGKRVLLCEDQQLNREIAKALLQKRGMIVDMVFNGLEGVNTFAKSTPGFYDVILMDIKMPVMNGYVSTEKIRELSHPQAKTIPIIAMTADAFSDDIKRAFASGMNGHIAKPISPQKMFMTMAEIMDKSK